MLRTVDVITVDVDFALHIFVVIIVVVLVVTDRQLFVVNLNVVHVTMMPLVHAVDVERKFAIPASRVIIEKDVARDIIAKLCRTIFILCK